MSGVYLEYVCHICHVTVLYQGQSRELPIYAVKIEGPTLFGREWLESIRLNWLLLCLETSDTIPALDNVLSNHASVFSEGLGKMKNIQAQIQIKESARPWFWKACLVVLAQKPAVDEADESWKEL